MGSTGISRRVYILGVASSASFTLLVAPSVSLPRQALMRLWPFLTKVHRVSKRSGADRYATAAAVAGLKTLCWQHIVTTRRTPCFW